MIEAVHSSGPISPIRLLELKKLTEQCEAEIIFVTAFLERNTFRQFAPEIAWETEVWIADAPDHIIHFDGEKFLGPSECEIICVILGQILNKQMPEPNPVNPWKCKPYCVSPSLYC